MSTRTREKSARSRQAAIEPGSNHNPEDVRPHAQTTSTGESGCGEKKGRQVDRRMVLLTAGLVLIVLAAVANHYKNVFHLVHAVPESASVQNPRSGSTVARDEYEKGVQAPAGARGPSPAALTRHAAELCRDRKYEECLGEAQKAIEIRPDYAEAYNNKGYALIAMNRLDEAIRAFREAVRLKPDYATAKDNLARALEQKRREQAGDGPARQ